MAVIQSLGRLADVEMGWMPAYTYSSMAMYGGHYYDYAALYRLQPNVRVCVDFLARNIAQLGLHVYRRVSETDRVRLRDHPLALLIEQPLPPEFKVTRYRLIESLISDLGIYFNAFWLKIKRESGNRAGMGLLRIPPQLVTVEGGLVPTSYKLALGTETRTVGPDEIVHFRGYNPENAVTGLSPMETLRRVLAEEDAAGNYREHFWGNAARMGGVIERPAEAPEWGEAARARFKQEFEALYSGEDNSGRTAILEEGMSWKQTTFNAQESEYLAGRKLTREECARAYHIPLPMVGILDHATFSNIREQHKNLYQDSLGPWLASTEDDVELQLLPDFDDTEGVYVEFNIAEKLQGSFEEQADTLNSAVGRPWMTPDEARARMNLPSMGGDAGKLGIPLNVMVAGSSQQEAVSREQETDGKDGGKAAARLAQSKAQELDPTRMQSREQWERKWAQVLGEFFQRQERSFLSRLPKSKGQKGIDDVWYDPERWNEELAADWYQLAMMTAAEFAKWVAKELAGDIEEQMMAEYWMESARYAAANINQVSREQLAKALSAAQTEGGDARKAMRDLFGIWATSRALEIGRSGVTHAANFGSHEGARAGGLKTKTWQVNSTNPRDAHLAMHGETVPIGGLFSNGMRWPGDPTGGAENNANCQCSVRFGR